MKPLLIQAGLWRSLQHPVRHCTPSVSQYSMRCFGGGGGGRLLQAMEHKIATRTRGVKRKCFEREEEEEG